MQMQTWMFYSYKGGAGRTVASANIGAALAKLGKRVLVIDMDFEAPGLHTVFGVEKTCVYKQRLGIQHYFKGQVPLTGVRETLVIDLLNDEGLTVKFKLPPDAQNGCLLYLMASPQYAEITGVRKLDNLLKQLIAKLGDVESLDYVILDAASGIREAFSLSINACTHLMVFFRWSLQHLEGAIRIEELMTKMKPLNDSIYRPHKYVVAAVPGEGELGLVGEMERRALTEAKKRSMDRLKEKLGDDNPLFGEIPELPILKWQERVIVLNEDGTAYEQIACEMLQVD
jgi:MinD-like ATPase involved in chromosome partitioning or flagellar assembly